MIARRRSAIWLAIAALLSLTVTVQSLRDPDVWWHVAIGRLITGSGIPSQEPFSFTPAARGWIGQGWLYEVTVARLVDLGPGLASLVMGLLATLALVLAALAAPRATRAPGPWLLLSVMVSALVAGQVLGVRSQVITVLGAAATLLVLARWREGSSLAVWALPPLLLVWANLHAGFVVGLAIPLVALVVHRPRPGAPAVDRRALALATGLAALATLLNPGGAGIYPYVAETFGNPTLTQSIVEWMSPNFHDLYPRLFEVEAIGLVALWMAGGPAEPVDLVLAGGAVAATLQAQRNVALFAVVAVPQLLRYGTETWKRLQPAVGRRLRGLAGRLPPRLRSGPGLAGRPLRLRPRPLLLPMTAAAVAVGVAAGLAPELSAAGAATHEASTFSRAAVDDVLARHRGERVYALYEEGGYLAYREPAGRVVFIYGESAIFGNAGLQRYLDIHLLRPGWPDAIRREGFRVAVLPSRSQEVAAFAVVGWRVECRDPVGDRVVMVPPPEGQHPPGAGSPATGAPPPC